MRQQHPFLTKLAEYAKDIPGLETAGNLAGRFNRIVEGTGLPSAARGLFEPGIEMGRGIANLIPGINIQKQQLPELNVNPLVDIGAQTAGSLAIMSPLFKGYQAAKSGIGGLPYLRNIPEAARNIGLAGLFGSATSPDNRKLGGVIGAGAEAVPAIAQKIMSLKPDAYKAIQEGYDTKLKRLGNMFESVEKDVAKKGIKQIKLPEQLFDEIEQVGPQSKIFKKFLEKAKGGSYKDLRKLNTELFKRGQKYSSSIFPSDVERGEDMFAARNQLNDVISKALDSVGLNESADKLRKAMGGYKNLAETYHSHPTISKLVGPSRKIPQKSGVLREQSTEINRLRAMHPEIKKQQDFEKKLRAAAAIGGLGVVGGGLHAVNVLRDLFS